MSRVQRAVVEALRTAGHDATYAADTNRRADDKVLVMLAQTEDRVIVTEDFDFGELLIRQQLKAPGAIVLHLPGTSPRERAARLIKVTQLKDITLVDRLTIVSARRVRQRPLVAQLTKPASPRAR